jgi:hypothetical protein
MNDSLLALATGVILTLNSFLVVQTFACLDE